MHVRAEARRLPWIPDSGSFKEGARVEFGRRYGKRPATNELV